MPHEHPGVPRFILINAAEISGSARVQRARTKIPDKCSRHTKQAARPIWVERETNMLRTTILALAALTAIGVTTLPAADASAHGYRGWHHRHWHHGWHHRWHHGWRHHRHYGWYHRWHGRV
jgi:hypothetical protein